jgi:hypothetical protein
MMRHAKISKVIIYTPSHDSHNEKVIRSAFANDVLMTKVVSMDSDYVFILNFTEKCKKISYSLASFIITPEMAKNIEEETHKMTPLSLLYSSKI